MKFNRIFAALLALLLCLGCLPLQARAETIASGTCGESVIWELSDQGMLTISGSGDMYDYSTMDNPAPWMGNRDAIKTVVVESGVTSIGAYAFYYCQSLETVTMAEGVLTIGAAAFDSCQNLRELSLADSITKIGVNAFSACRSLEFLKLPAKLKRIPGFMCYDCRNLKVIVISKTTYEIGRDAFSWCTNLWHVLYTGSKSQWKQITIQGSVQNSEFCLESATRHYKCDGTEVTDVKNKLCSVCSGDCAHVWNNGVVKKEPTCTEDGQMRYTCSKCEETKNESISALGHEYTAEVTAPTCTEQGYTVYTCSRCQDTMTQDFTDPKGHAWDEGIITQEPTETAVGQLLHTCTACGEARIEEIPMKEPAPTEPTEPTQPTQTPPTEPAPTDPVQTIPGTEPTQPPANANEDDSNHFGTLIILATIAVCIGGAAIILTKKKRT